ncbi:MAG TPA: V-type ATP synthase subunit D [Bacteroidales bacterium]|nr:V-type ATP synthase subunit D [Bacteroidales bacterium]
MALKFEYNKTSLQNLNRQLNIRQRALPTLKNKESVLRVEVKNARREAMNLAAEIDRLLLEQGKGVRLWTEFDPSLVKVNEVVYRYRKIAGVSIPEAEDIIFDVKKFNIFSEPKWYYEGVELLKILIQMEVKRRLLEDKSILLEDARKKTTRKVNLFEKVQIPAYENAIRKIKRFLEDEENLARAAQKIVKRRAEREGEAQRSWG